MAKKIIQVCVATGLICLALILLGNVFQDVLPYITNKGTVPTTIREGMCLTSSDKEFPNCIDVYIVKRVGKFNVLLTAKSYRDNMEHYFEFPITHIQRYYSEVYCNCDGWMAKFK